MSRATRALPRLAVLTATTVLAVGLVPTAASAAPYPPTGLNVTSINISADQTAAVGTCVPYTVTFTTQNGTPGGSFTAEVIQPAPSTSSMTIGFCEPQDGNDSTPFGPTQAAPDSDNTSGAAADQGATTCTKSAPTAGDTVGCETTYGDSDADNTVIIGVQSNQPGTMTVQVFADKDGPPFGPSGDPSGSEAHDTALQTWVTPTQPFTVDCSPETDSNPTATSHQWTCTVTDANQVLVPSETIQWKVQPADSSNPTVADPNKSGSCTTGNNESADDPNDTGIARCSYTNNGRAGTDIIRNWIDLEATPNTAYDNGEPFDDITKNWVEPAPSGSTLSLSCSPNQTSTGGSNPTCDEPTSQGTVAITATVKNDGSAVAGALVTFDKPTDTSSAGKSDSGDTEQVDPASCATDAQGQCSVNFSDSAPKAGESFTVKGHLVRAGQADSTATATITYSATASNSKSDARVIDVTPNTASKSTGGSQQFSAKVTDRVGDPVAGVLVKWDEAGPGNFSGGSSSSKCTTGAGGSCQVTVTSHDSDEGTETVTGAIDISNYPQATPTSNNYECQAPAGKTYTKPSSSISPGTATGAPQGKCKDAGAVAWTAATAQKEDPHLRCWSPRKHVLKCKVVSHPRLDGTHVTFRRVHKDGSLGKRIARRTTNSKGVAKFKRTRLQSDKVWRIKARVHGQGNVKGGLSNKERVKIK